MSREYFTKRDISRNALGHGLRYVNDENMFFYSDDCRGSVEVIFDAMVFVCDIDPIAHEYFIEFIEFLIENKFNKI